MDDTIAVGASIAVELLVIGIVISIFFSINAGLMNMQRGFVNYVIDAANSADGSEIRAMQEFGKPLPAATILLLCEKNAANGTLRYFRNQSNAIVWAGVVSPDPNGYATFLRPYLHKKLYYNIYDVGDGVFDLRILGEVG